MLLSMYIKNLQMKEPETLTAVGGGVKHSKKLPFWRLVCRA